MTNPEPAQPDTHSADPRSRDGWPVAAKSIERYHDCYGGIGATVYETRFADATRRYSVVFRRDVSDLALEGSFHSLGQDELMDLIAAASNAYYHIDHLRSRRQCGEFPDVPYDTLTPEAGWEPAKPEEYYHSQIEEA